MTKRRAENILPPEIPHKVCFHSLSIIDNAVGGVDMVRNANASFVSFVGQRSRKRPNFTEDQDSPDTDNLPRKVPANIVNAVMADKNTSKSRNFEHPGRAVARQSSRTLEFEANKKPEENNKHTAVDKVMRTDEDHSAFNSFQFWRVPLPELDLSLLETESSDGPNATFSAKALEAMET
ncbi:serine/threonine-protein phosphatase 4 regulatory subunit 1 [Xyrauchen texanus]|uniref:serine/threonine-protein phosphatase 4 regulatory subunit 1 n=1 Tax=Xyrauchen texanus TaxID=154827 RepID=UPI002242C129|nr:serine/threonine-protein phosphatase 4 regulatory subunit 1 [Xyrauchen texanus]